MKSILEQWLLEGIEPPADFDREAALEAEPQWRDVAADLADIDRATTQLGTLEAPAELDDAIWAITETPQDAVMPSQSATMVSLPRAANRRWWLLPVVAVAAAALLLVVNLNPETTPVGDPNDWTERGLDPGLGPEINLKMAVKDPKGSLSRLDRGAQYNAGDLLLFHVDSPADGTIRLLRVSESGVEPLHSQEIHAGTENLQTSEGAVGYELESGETAAVFAIVRFEQPLSVDQLKRGIPAVNDPEAVCVAVRALGGRCSAERVEAIR